jgi:hypothetical protein
MHIRELKAIHIKRQQENNEEGISLSENTLRTKNKSLMEKAKYAEDGSSLKKDAKSVRRINRHMEREKKRKEQKALQPAYEVFVNNNSFRVTGVKSEEEAIDKLSKWSAFHNMVNKMKQNDEEVNIHAKKI